MFKFIQALLELLLEVGSRVVAAFCGPRNNHDAIRCTKGEE